MSLVKKPAGMCKVISSGFAVGSAGFSVAAAAFFAFRLFLFCNGSCVEALSCLSSGDTLGAGVVSALVTYFCCIENSCVIDLKKCMMFIENYGSKRKQQLIV